MKKFLSLTLAAALTLALIAACGCSANVSTHPGGMITEETTHIMPTPTATRRSSVIRRLTFSSFSAASGWFSPPSEKPRRLPPCLRIFR